MFIQIFVYINSFKHKNLSLNFAKSTLLSLAELVISETAFKMGGVYMEKAVSVEKDVPQFAEFRVWVDKIEKFRDRVLIETFYLTAARAMELLTKISPSDIKYKKTTCYGPLATWSLGEYMNEKALLIKIRVGKHKKPTYRVVALPCNPIYEPWTLDLLKWIKQTGKISFDLSRSGATKILQRHLEQYWPGIHLHSLRHFRCTHLCEVYGFGPMDLVTYMGWTYRTAFGISMLDRYMHLSWKDYFPKLLRPLKG